MQTSFPAALFATLLALTSISYAYHADTISWRRLLTLNGDKIDSASGQGQDNTEALASTLQSALLKIFVSWSSTDDTISALDQDVPDGIHDEPYDEQQLLLHLLQILNVAESLSQAPDSCKSSAGGSSDATSPSCPAPAPELLQGNTLSFLSSVLRTYPRGPTSRQALVNWTAAATAFLQDHQRRQRQQRLATQRAVDHHAAMVAANLAASRTHGGRRRTSARTTEMEMAEAVLGQGTAARQQGSSMGDCGKSRSNSSPGASSGGLGEESPSKQLPPLHQHHHYQQQQQEEPQQQQQQQKLHAVRRHRRRQHRRQLLVAPQTSASTAVSDAHHSGRNAIITTPGRSACNYTRDSETGEGSVQHLPCVGFRSGEAVIRRCKPSLGAGTGGWRRRVTSYNNNTRGISTNTSNSSSSSSSNNDNSSSSSPGESSSGLHVVHRHTASSHSSSAYASGLPLVRRVLLAQLLLGWATGLQKELPVSDDVATGLAKAFTMLYYIHVDSVVDRAALEYFHISKAGGTSWTAAAKANGCSIPGAKAARTPEFDDNCRWFDPEVLMRMGLSSVQASRTLVCPRYGIMERRSALRDCGRRLEHFRRIGLQYTNNEYTLHGGQDGMYGTHICPQFVNVATIREPLDRLLSNLRYMLVQLKRERALPAKLFSEAFCNRSAADWEIYAPPVADNYNIRTLVGERAFHTPLHGIGEAHEAVAKKLLLQYDLVLDLNSGSHAAALLMRSGLGWNTTLADVHIWTSEKLARMGNLDFNTCPLGDVEPLLTSQGYDQRWYSFGRALSHLDQLFLSTAAHLGLKPWPQDWEDRQLGSPPADGIVWSECGLIGLVPPLPHHSLPPILEKPPSNTTMGLSPSPLPSGVS